MKLKKPKRLKVIVVDPAARTIRVASVGRTMGDLQKLLGCPIVASLPLMLTKFGSEIHVARRSAAQFHKPPLPRWRMGDEVTFGVGLLMGWDTGKLIALDCPMWISGVQKLVTWLVPEEECPGHVGAEHDAKRCLHCDIHIDELRPEETEP